MSALIHRFRHDASIALDDTRPAEHRFAVEALMFTILFTVGPVSAVLMLIAQA
jgi:hypothetical protein